MTDSRRILILGGTSWLGGATATVAQGRGHHVVCLARGQAGDAPAGVRLVRADRRQPGAYDEVRDQDWDAVIEVSRQPELVRSALAALGGRAAHWVYVSSVSVYADHSVPYVDESAAIHPAWEGSGEADEDSYGPAKVSCETACADALPVDRLTIVRPGLIAGYGDLSDRVGYWPARIARALVDDPVLVPPPDMPVQLVDVLDLAQWLVDLAQTRTPGVFDAVGDVLPFADLAAVCADVAGTRPGLAAAGHNWLVEHEVAPWAGPDSLPLWLPVPDYAGMLTHRNDAAKAAGLRLRPLADTLVDALAWERELGLERERAAGLSPRREAELLRQLPTP